MYYNIDKLKKAFKAGKKLKYIFFWGHRPKTKGIIDKSCFSQWWPASFTVGDVKYFTSEHWMMAEKARLFKDNETEKKIINASSPALAKKLGRQIESFNDKIWNEHKFEIVAQGSYHKFSQNEDLKKFLLNTKKRILVEASPVDKVWGIGLAQDNEHSENPLLWKGQNLLGFALMKARDKLIKK